MIALKKLFRIMIFLLFVCPLTSCGVLDAPIKAYKSAKNYVFPPGEKLYWKSLDILIRENANMNYPIAIDITLIKNDGLLKKILELDSSKWFEQKNMLLKTFSEDIVLRSWELAPGDGVAVPNEFFKDERVFGALVFAKYFNDGDYKARIDNLEGIVVIDFGIDEFNAYAIKPN